MTGPVPAACPIVLDPESQPPRSVIARSLRPRRFHRTWDATRAAASLRRATKEHQRADHQARGHGKAVGERRFGAHRQAREASTRWPAVAGLCPHAPFNKRSSAPVNVPDGGGAPFDLPTWPPRPARCTCSRTLPCPFGPRNTARINRPGARNAARRPGGPRSESVAQETIAAFRQVGSLRIASSASPKCGREKRVVTMPSVRIRPLRK